MKNDNREMVRLNQAQVTAFASLSMLVVAFAGCVASAGPDGDTESEDMAEAKQALSIPAGWSPVGLQAPNGGVSLYKKSGAESYVTIVNLKLATLRNITGQSIVPAGGSASYKSVPRKAYTAFWPDAKALETSTSKLRVVFSGTFGSVSDPSYTPIAFGLKKDSSIISLGYAAPGGPAPENLATMLFTFRNSMSRAWIGGYNLDSFNISPDIVGGLDVTAPKNAGAWIQRTFIGVRDDDGDGNAETVMVLSATSATQAAASSTLDSFGAQQKIMLDGSGSTFLMVDGVTKIPTDGRKIGHAVAVFSGK